MNIRGQLLTYSIIHLSMLTSATAQAGEPARNPDRSIDQAALARWSAPYRGWNYWPGHVSASEPHIPGHETFCSTDCPTVFQLPGKTGVWYMSFIAFDGSGYNSFVAESDDLIHWKNPRLAMGFGPENEFDHGGCVVGAYLYESYDVKAPRVLKSAMESIGHCTAPIRAKAATSFGPDTKASR